MSATNKSYHAALSDQKSKSSSAMHNDRFRKSKATQNQFFIDELNAKRAHFNLPKKVSLTLPRPSLKGKKKPDYSPPIKLSQDKLTKWKYDERLKRKAAKQRENRRIKSELLKSFKKQLAILNKMIEDEKKGVKIVALDDGILASMYNELKTISIEPPKLEPEQSIPSRIKTRAPRWPWSLMLLSMTAEQHFYSMAD